MNTNKPQECIPKAIEVPTKKLIKLFQAEGKIGELWIIDYMRDAYDIGKKEAEET